MPHFLGVPGCQANPSMRNVANGVCGIDVNKWLALPLDYIKSSVSDLNFVTSSGGLMLFISNPSTNEYRLNSYQTGRTVPIPSLIERTIKDDFDFYTDATMWTKGGVGTPSVTVLMPTATDYGGILNLTTTAANNDNTYIKSTNGIIQSNIPNMRLFFYLKPLSLANQKIQVGLSSNPATPDAGAGIYTLGLECNSGNGVPGDWYTLINNNAAPTKVDTTVAASSANYTLIELVWDATGANVQAYVNGVAAGATFAAMATQTLSIFVKQQTLTTSAKTTYLDMIAFIQQSRAV